MRDRVEAAGVVAARADDEVAAPARPTVATTSTPAAASAAATASVVPLFVKMTARSPGRTP